MFESITVIGSSGRVGSAVSARLRERGVDVRDTAPAELVLLCVPDRAIAEVARTVPAGPWVAHMSGATPLAALEPHEQRFSLHPLQTFVRERGPEQLDGAWGAVTAESEEGRRLGFELARLLGLEPFELHDGDRALYHAGAAFAAAFLVTLHRAAVELVHAAGAPAEALLPLMRRTMENDFAPTGPITRGDWTTIESHRRAIAERVPRLTPLYDALVEASR